MSGRRAALIVILGACAPPLALACSRFGEDATPEDGGGADGTSSQIDGGGGREGSRPLADGGFLEDGAIAPFSSKCQPGDPREDEDASDGGNGTDIGANLLPTPTSVVCGVMQPGGDRDVFRYEAETAAVVRVGFHISGNGKLAYVGPGVNGAPGAASPSFYRGFDLEIASPGTIYFTVSATTQQEYRLVVSQ